VAVNKAAIGKSSQVAWTVVVTGSRAIMTPSQTAGARSADAQGRPRVAIRRLTHQMTIPTTADSTMTVAPRPYWAMISMTAAYGPAYPPASPGQTAARPPGPTPRKWEPAATAKAWLISRQWIDQGRAGSSPTSAQRQAIAPWKTTTAAAPSTVTTAATRQRHAASQTSPMTRQPMKAIDRWVVQTTQVAATAATGYVQRRRRSCSSAKPIGISASPATSEPAR